MDEEGALACSENRTSLSILEFVFNIFEDDVYDKISVKLKVYQGILPNYIRYEIVFQFKTLNDYNSRVRYKPNIE